MMSTAAPAGDLGRPLPIDDGWREPRLHSRSRWVDIRGTRIHLRCWGREDAPLLVLLHGWMDLSVSFQFFVDACQGDWHFVAPDWAGYGLSEQRLSYSLYEYVADLHALIETLSPDAPARVVAHSMGGNIATLLAGALPERVHSLVNMEGLTPLRGASELPASKRLARWLVGQRKPRPVRVYPDHAALAQRLQSGNARLSHDKAAFLAQHLGQAAADGQVHLALDPKVYYSVPLFPHVDQILQCWNQITAPVLFVLGDDSMVVRAYSGHEADLEARLNSVSVHQRVQLAQAGHNMHHDQPHQLAQAVEAFLAAHRRDAQG